jgi:Na+-driven multidrug efflux pump
LLPIIIKNAIKYKMNDWIPRKGYIFKYILESIPLSVRNIAIWTTVLISVYVITHLGAEYIVAMQIIDSVEIVAMFTFDALAGASQTLVGESIGAKNNKKTIYVMKRSHRIARVFTPFNIIIYLILAYIIPILTTNDKKVHSLVMITAIILISTLLIKNYVFINDGILQGFKEYTFLMFSSLIPMLITCFAMILAMNASVSATVEFIIQYTLFDVSFILGRGVFSFFKMREIHKMLNNN